MVKEIEIAEIGVEEGVDLSFGIEDHVLPNLVFKWRGDSSFKVV